MVIYEGEELIVHYNQGTSRDLLVTFAPAYREHVAETYYFARSAVEQRAYNCIGITTKVRAYYVTPEMDEVYRLVEQHARRARRIIVMGHSMGGWAALKFSGRLKADRVICFAPTYSLDPDDLDLQSELHRKILVRNMAQHKVVARPGHKNMGIKPEDVSGGITVIYDPNDGIDDYNVDMLKRRLPPFQVLPFANLGHDLASGFDHSDIMVQVVEAVEADDLPRVRRILLGVQRVAGHFIQHTIERAAWKHPLLCYRALWSLRVRQHKDYDKLVTAPINGVVIYALFQRGWRSEAYKHFLLMMEKIHGVRTDVPKNFEHMPVPQLLEAYPCLLLSPHGQVLVFDSINKHVRFETTFYTGRSLPPVMVRTRNGRTQLTVSTGNGVMPITPDTLPIIRDAQETLSTEAGDNHLVVGGTAGFLSSAANQLVLPATEAANWQERFVPIPVLEGSMLLKAASVSWFDQKLLATPPAAPAPVAAAPRKKAKFQIFGMLRKRDNEAQQ
jgi:pimeloyl-ACP methyl ester carboxylesterase